jgi:hypothetical protein
LPPHRGQAHGTQRINIPEICNAKNGSNQTEYTYHLGKSCIRRNSSKLKPPTIATNIAATVENTVRNSVKEM